MLTEERCKQLMEQVGMPESRSIMIALYQVANETEQEATAPLLEEIERLKNRCAELEKDAGRYRKWREDYAYSKIGPESCLGGLADAWSFSDVDAAIDSAMSGQEKS